MNSIFTRTLLWLIATVILTFVAITVATALDFDPGERRRGPFGALVSLQASEAVRAWETGGKTELEDTLKRFRDATDAEAILTDANGRDLVTGEDRTDIARDFRRQRRGPFWKRDRTILARRSENGRYMYFVLLQRRNMVRWFLQPEVNLTTLAVLTIISWVFARRLTNPVRDLQRAVECFGRGQFNVRVHSLRKDEIGTLAQTFDRMAERIETLLAAERRLLLDISHELRSPLARLGLAVELARTSDNPAQQFDRIEKEAARLNTLVGELLQVTRVEGDASRMRREPIDIPHLTGEIVGDARVEAEARNRRVELENVQNEPEPSFTGDPELLRRAIENVVRNAVRHTAEGAAVLVKVQNEPKGVRIEVRDHGPGVPPEHLTRIFDPFYRVETDRNRESGGVGLGLAIARRAVEVHGGSVHAENADPGLRVVMRLPAGR